ncbi:MAG: DEAD/DEAH box helicase [Povalibacter sp.]
MSFTDLGLPPELIAALAKQQIAEPTPIQTAALPVLLGGEDAYLHAETGTGKTLAYLLPLFCRIDRALAATQAIIVAPTHELAIQIQRQCSELALNAGWPIRSVLLIGGTALDRQIEKLKKKPHIAVGSPGRVAELIDKGKLKAKFFRTIVIDEADRLLSDESFSAIRSVVQAANAERQLVFASATQEPQTLAALASLAANVKMLEAGTAAVNENIEHLYLVCEERDKPDELRKLLHALQPERAIVFVHRNDSAEKIAAKLAHHQIAVADLTASLHKEDRKRAMDGFRSAAVHVLIASDVAARGLDIKGVTHIFNYDVPTLSKTYLHRVGRTARAGAKGVAVSLANEVEARLVSRYETELNIRLQRVRMREGRVLPVD